MKIFFIVKRLGRSLRDKMIVNRRLLNFSGSILRISGMFLNCMKKNKIMMIMSLTKCFGNQPIHFYKMKGNRANQEK